jgi:hypothetical protein
VKYRSDLDAARARVEALEEEVRALRDEQAKKNAPKGKPPAKKKPQKQGGGKSRAPSAGAQAAEGPYASIAESRLRGAGAVAGLVLFNVILMVTISWPPASYMMQAVGLLVGAPLVFGGVMRMANPNIGERYKDPDNGWTEVYHTRETSLRHVLGGIALYLVMLAISSIYKFGL